MIRGLKTLKMWFNPIQPPFQLNWSDNFEVTQVKRLDKMDLVMPELDKLGPKRIIKKKVTDFTLTLRWLLLIRICSPMNVTRLKVMVKEPSSWFCLTTSTLISKGLIFWREKWSNHRQFPSFLPKSNIYPLFLTGHIYKGPSLPHSFAQLKFEWSGNGMYHHLKISLNSMIQIHHWFTSIDFQL